MKRSVSNKFDGARLRDRDGAAHYLQVSTRSIDRLIEAGQLPIVRLPAERARNGHGQVGTSRRILIDVKDLDALIERSKETVWHPDQRSTKGRG